MLLIRSIFAPDVAVKTGRRRAHRTARRGRAARRGRRACLPPPRTLHWALPVGRPAGGGPHRGSDPVQSQPTNRVRAGRQQR